MAAKVKKKLIRNQQKIDVPVDISFLPDKLRHRLMPFQKEGVIFAIKKNGRCLIADEMGLGKTLQALSVALYYQDEWPLLIIVPSSLRYPWIEEIEKWLPQIDPLDINLIQNGGDISDIPKSKISIVTFGLLRNPSSRIVQEALINQEFGMVIVDESHYMKNRRSATSKYLVPLIQNAARKLLLTGTPALARPEELFPQIDAIARNEFGNWSQFAKRYCNAHMQYFGRGRRWCTDGASNLHELQVQLSDKIMIRRLKKDVLTQLPPKQRQRISFELKDSVHKKDLDSTWLEMEKIMSNLKMDMMQALKGGRGGAGSGVPDNQGGDEPGFFEVRKLTSQLFVKTATAKIGPVKDYVKMLCDNQGLKFLVFAYHHLMMDGIAECLHDENITYIRIDGKTPADERPVLVKRFQVDPTTRVAILSIKAAGVGLTLTAAKLVVFAELDWTPGVLEQCEDRAHRIGQKDTVHIHYLVAKGSLDEWVWSALCRKTAVVTTTLNGQRQVLRMDEGNQCQVKLLANADAWIPTQKPSAEDISTFFQSQRQRNQKSLLEFFSPKSKEQKQSVGEINSDEKSPAKPSTSKCKDKPVVASSKIVLIDSDSDGEEDFRLAPVKPLKKHSHNSQSSEGKAELDIQLDPDELPDLVRPKRRKTLPSTSSPGDLIDAEKLDCTENKHADKVPINQSAEDSELLGNKNVQSVEESSSNWNCGVCTFINHAGLPYCEMCNSPKTKKTKKLRDMTESKGKLAGSNMRKQGGKKSRSSLTPRLNKSKSGSLTRYLSPSLSKKTATEISSDAAELSGTELDSPIHKKTKLPMQLTPSVTKHTKNIYNVDSDVETIDSEGSVISRDVKHDELIIEDDSDVEEGAGVDSRGVINQGTDMEIEEFDSQVLQESTLVLKSDGKRVIRTKEEGNSLIGTNSPQNCAAVKDICTTPNAKQYRALNNPSSSNMSDVIEAELAAAKQVFSPGFRKASAVLSNADWRCPHCKTLNDSDMEDCDGCFKAKPCDDKWTCISCKSSNDVTMEDCDECFTPREKTNVIEDGAHDILDATDSCAVPKSASDGGNRIVDLDQVPVYDVFKYCCSKNSSRIYLFNSNGEALNVNFTPLDVDMNNYGDLPDILLHPQNLRLVKRFVRSWNSLSLMKQRMIIRSGQVFTNPCLLYEDLKSEKKSTQRYTTKADVAMAAMSKAEQIGGSVRVVTRPDMAVSRKRKRNDPAKETPNNIDEIHPGPSSGNKQTLLFGTAEPSKPEETQEEILERMKGIMQAVDADGNPLCIHCHKVYRSNLVTKATLSSNPWSTRFCSKNCMEQYWLRRYGDYGRKQVFEIEQGICQMCGFDAYKFFERLRTTHDLRKRAKLVQESKFKDMKITIKEKMVRNPVQGLFWHVDHITAVSEGGGECDVDNLRTLCTPCHLVHTAEQTRNRAHQTKLREAANCHDITAFFQPSSSTS